MHLALTALAAAPAPSVRPTGDPVNMSGGRRRVVGNHLIDGGGCFVEGASASVVGGRVEGIDWAGWGSGARRKIGGGLGPRPACSGGPAGSRHGFSINLRWQLVLVVVNLRFVNLNNVVEIFVGYWFE